MRYAILEHHRKGEVHWDLLLASPSGDLETWALQARPDSPGIQPALRLPPHRPLYLNYDGPVLPDRGYVRRWDQGSYRVAQMGDRQAILLLRGRRLHGVLELREKRDDEWSFHFTPWAAHG